MVAIMFFSKIILTRNLLDAQPPAFIYKYLYSTGYYYISQILFMGEINFSPKESTNKKYFYSRDRYYYYIT